MLPLNLTDRDVKQLSKWPASSVRSTAHIFVSPPFRLNSLATLFPGSFVFLTRFHCVHPDNPVRFMNVSQKVWGDELPWSRGMMEEPVSIRLASYTLTLASCAAFDIVVYEHKYSSREVERRMDRSPPILSRAHMRPKSLFHCESTSRMRNEFAYQRPTYPICIIFVNTKVF